jgi:hypothetical protein
MEKKWMVCFNGEKLMDNTISTIAKTLGAFRAENLGDKLFSLYTKPAYFPKLLTPIACLLQGGRGTGKTTVLKSLSYEGQFQLLGNNFESFNKQDYLGLYYKLETGLVSAFSGAGKDNEFWKGIFSHFMNLQLSKLVCEVGIWYENRKGSKLSLKEDQLQIFCKSIGIDFELDLESIKQKIELAIASLESDINFAYDATSTRYTPIGGPPRRLIKILRNTSELKEKIFYFLFDEYENLYEYQQTILNTFIKQADSELTFKVGVKELGLKTKKTLNQNEQLVDPADYVLIDVAHQLNESEFDEFSRNVLGHRFEQLKDQGVEIFGKINELFEDLTEEEEAIRLGADKVAEEVKSEIKKVATKNQIAEIKHFNDREYALMQFLSNSSEPVYQIFVKALSDPGGWTNRVNNYGYAALFSLRKKKVGITKYYSGWNTFLALSAGNIRYLLQLVTNSLTEHVKDGHSLSEKISAKNQTEVAAEVGKKNLLELEGLSTRGAQLMKLVLGLGQVFHEMAMQPEGHAPEITQFEVSKSAPASELMHQVNELIYAAVMHLALLRTSGTKLGGPGDIRDFDYMLHPIFAPFFVYSHRRKRKFIISAEELLGLISSHSTTIKAILSKQNRTPAAELPEQLQLFGGFYERNS